MFLSPRQAETAPGGVSKSITISLYIYTYSYCFGKVFLVFGVVLLLWGRFYYFGTLFLLLGSFVSKLEENTLN